MKKHLRVKIYADLMDDPARLEEVIKDRAKRRKIFHIAFWIVIACQVVPILINLFTENHTPVNTMQWIFIVLMMIVYVSLETEWQMLHIIRRLQQPGRN